MDRLKLPATRTGTTTKIQCGPVTLYVTVNEDREIFVKADEGWQGWADVLAETASLALQYGCPMDVLMRHWRGHRFDPQGIGQGSSIPDAIARGMGHEKTA